MRQCLCLVLLLGIANVAAMAQQPAASARFEVTSVKPWTPPTTAASGVFTRPPAGSGSFNRTSTVAGLITYAYDLQDFQVSGGEEWTRTDRYVVAARAGRETSQAEMRDMKLSADAVRFHGDRNARAKIEKYEVNARIAGPRVRGDTWVMLRNLLKDRFGLHAHQESRSLEVFELRRLRPDTLGPNIRRPDPPCVTSGTDLTARCGYKEAVGTYDAKGLPIATIAGYLERLTGRPIVDLTTLTGDFDVSLRFNANVGRVPASTTVAQTELEDRPLIFTAVREQLGLKLEPATAPMEVLVIDAATKPSPD